MLHEVGVDTLIDLGHLAKLPRSENLFHKIGVLIGRLNESLHIFGLMIEFIAHVHFFI